MSATPIVFPSGLVPVRQPAWLQLSADGSIITTGTAAQFTITFLTASSAGNTVAITYNGLTITLTCAAALDDSGNTFQLGVTAVFAATNFEVGAKANYYLHRDFIITRAAEVVTFTARAKGSNFNPTSVVITPGGLATHATTQVGASPFLAANYSVRVRVWVETAWGSGIYEALPEQVASPKSPENQVKFDLATLLLPKVGYDWPAYGATSCLPALSLQRRFYYEWFEHYGSPAVPRRLDRWPVGAPNATSKALFMGFRQQDIGLGGNMLFELQFGPYWWLTWRMRRDAVEVSPRQQHYLGWYMFYERTAPGPGDPAEDIALQARIAYTDGTVGSWTTRYTDPPEGLTTGEIGLWPTGWTQLDMAAIADPAKTVWYYEVRLRAVGAGLTISEVGRFYLVEEDANELHIEYVNALGAIESIRTKGTWQLGLEADYEEVQRELGVYPADWEGARGTEPVGTLQTLRVNTGTATGPHELRAMAEVLLSPEVRLVDHDRQTKLPLRLTKGTHLARIQGDPDQEHIYTLNLEFQLGDPELVYSDVPSAV